MNHSPHSSPDAQQTGRPVPDQEKGLSLLLLLGVAALVALVGWRLSGRAHAESSLKEQTSQLAQQAVEVVTPQASNAPQELVLPGNVQAWSDAPIYARTGGYLKRWLVDIGEPVKAGQLLAEIDAPEVDQQLRQAQADLTAAEVASNQAQSTAERYKKLIDSHAVSNQEAEDNISNAEAKRAALASAKANVQRLKELQGFERVVAPFDGVVTARNVDVGALVVAGGGSGQALFRVADTRKLRVYVDVPESLSASIKPTLTADLRVSATPRQTFSAKLLNTSTAINATSRTLLTQWLVDNAQGALLPGSYAEVHIKIPGKADTLRLPGNTLLFRGDGLSVATVDAHNQILIKPVVQGRDFGKEVEILDGLQAHDRVIVNPSDSAVTGVPVRIATSTTAGAKPHESR